MPVKEDRNSQSRLPTPSMYRNYAGTVHANLRKCARVSADFVGLDFSFLRCALFRHVLVTASAPFTVGSMRPVTCMKERGVSIVLFRTFSHRNEF